MRSTVIGSPVMITGGAEDMTDVEIDLIDTSNGQPLGSVPLTQLIIQRSDPLVWPEDRYLIGWGPWMGFGKGSELECHALLIHNNGLDNQIFMIGPHKENPSVVYDCAKTEFFPPRFGRLVRAGEQVSVQVVANPTGTYAGIAVNVRIFSVKA